MLHAPLKADRAAAKAPPAEQLRTRERRKQPSRAMPTIGTARDEALWQTAPVLAGVVLFATVLVSWTMRAAVPPAMLLGWAAIVLAQAAWHIRARRQALGRGESRPDSWHLPFATGLLAISWAVVPTLFFGSAMPADQILVGSVFILMITCAGLLAICPAAAVAWAVPLAGALAAAMVAHVGSDALLPVALVAAFLATLLTGCTHVAQLLRRQLASAAAVEARAEAINSLLREYEEQGAGWLWQIDAHNRLAYVSPRISGLLGRPTAQLMGHSLPVLLGADARLGAALVARKPFTALEIQIGTPRGDRWISLSGSPIFATADAGFEGFRGVGSDVTEWRNSQQRLTHMASSDVLTGLPNRQRVRELLDAALRRAQTTGTACAVLFLDLDGFKPVNDTFGHATGDAVLRGVARRLSEEIGSVGHVGRMGGDEFAIVISPAESRDAVAYLSERLIQRVSEPYQVEGTQVRIGMSIGCAFGPADAATVDELVQKADLALYLAKAEGRGVFRHFDPRMQNKADERQRIEADLRLSLARSELELYYQPIVGAESRGVVGFEALLRWNHPRLGMIQPAAFIPLAEETGMISEIGEWVIRTACTAAVNWPDHINVAVNVSARQLVLPALPNAVSNALARSGLKPHRLELEVTESVFVDGDDSLDVLRRLRTLGVGIALDDFGTGYSSLGYLNKTIFHKLKIDGSFVRDAGKRPDSVAIIRAIVDIANSFRMTITAEGVETAADFNRMRDLGCHQIQGYLFGKPIPYEKTLALVGARYEAGIEVRKAG
jgi:diguanylate cyclase (GGDEF)-like protein